MRIFILLITIAVITGCANNNVLPKNDDRFSWDSSYFAKFTSEKPNALANCEIEIDRGVGNIDYINDRLISSNNESIIVSSKESKIKLEGWAADNLFEGLPLHVWLVLINTKNNDRYFLAGYRKERRDVMERFSKSEWQNAGFLFETTTNNLPIGHYKIVLLQIYNGNEGIALRFKNTLEIK